MSDPRLHTKGAENTFTHEGLKIYYVETDI